jgi:GntR family transcriptional regulator, rspAB operon transcriptional repressor
MHADDGATADQPGTGGNVAAAHQHVRRLILRGDLWPGQTISQTKLAGLCGVSRTPLREALRILRREGLITGEPNRQVTVAPFSLRDLEQIYAMRVALESAAVRCTVTKMTAEDVADPQGHVALMEHFAAGSDYERWEAPHQAFHQALVAKAGPRFARTLAELSDYGERYRRYYTEHGRRSWERGAREHRAILAAVKFADPEASAHNLVAHLAHTVHSVIALIDPGYDPLTLGSVLAGLPPDLGNTRDMLKRGAIRRPPESMPGHETEAGCGTRAHRADRPERNYGLRGPSAI